jgi:hypothetical protein
LFAFSIHLEFSTGSSISVVATAISEIVKKLSETPISFDFIVYSDELDYLVNKIAKLVDKPANVFKVQNTKKSAKVHVKQSAIVFADQKDLPGLYNRTVLTNESPQDFHFFIYIAGFNGEIEQVSPKEFLKSDKIHRFCYYLLDRNHFIDLVTYTMFQKRKCRELNQITVNRFSKEILEWETDKFAIKKFRNFNRCELVVYFEYPGNTYDIAIFELIQASLTSDTTWIVFNPKTKEYLTEKPAGRKMEFTFRVDKIRTVMNDNQKLRKKFAITNPVFDGYKLLFVTKFLPYTMLEKALLPFDPEVWWWLIGFLTAGVVSITVVSFMKEKVKKFVFGLRVKVPLLNMM